MNTSALDATSIAPLQHKPAMRLLQHELQRTVDLLGALTPAQWSAATVCPGWDVRRMYLHVLGACAGSASMREGLHQMRAANRRRKSSGGPLEANLSAVQIDERELMVPQQIVEQLKAIAPKTVKARARLPRPMRQLAKIKVDGPVVETWSLGYLVDTIYLRDLWMHRLDASDATNREMVLSAEHDGCIVADIVGEWARRHGQPFTLELTGAAGGQFFVGTGGEQIVLDGLEFCRALSGRSSAAGLLTTVVPF
ncbi:MAG: maleylpyruvate isomerase family mycothiol-dependent enzyme [Actinomycetia bacterium]|nr:maleylpyruvate isomerase family mycothiol-dependent enzyme [Actinomycetes bacterium]